MSHRSILRQMWQWSRLSPIKLLVILGLTLAQIISIALILFVFNEIDQSSGQEVLLSTFRMVMVGTTISLGFFFSRLLSIRFAVNAIAHLRTEFIDFLCSRSIAFFARQGSASIHATILTDTERLQKFYEVLLGQILPAVIIGSGATVILFLLSPVLSLYLAISTPLFLIANYLILRPLSHQVLYRNNAFKSYSRSLLSFISRFMLIRLQTAEDQEKKLQAEFIERLKQTSFIYSRQQTIHLAFLNSMLLILIGVFLLIGGTQVLTRQLSLSNLLAYNVILIALRRYIQDAFSALPTLTDGYQALQTLGVFFHSAPAEPYQGKRRYDVSAAFSLHQVKFEYTPGSLILKGISLNLRRGLTTAITGPNGSGKTTIVNLLLGLYQPQEGMLFADEVPYTELDIPYLRRQIGVLLQETWLFEGTIWDNITYGFPHAEKQFVHSVARLTAAHEFIESLAEGYQSWIGERGVMLSGGQRQLIALTRVLLRKPKLLILDEPTNHLDQKAVQTLIGNLAEGMTSMFDSNDARLAILVITHDYGLASLADCVYSLQDGKLFEEKCPRAQPTPMIIGAEKK